MPFVIYIFALATFALGLSEFIVIGMAHSIAASFQVDPSKVGSTVTAYALGVTLGGAALPALSKNFRQEAKLFAALAAFTVAHAVMVFAPSLWLVVGSRVLAGLGHGLFLAVASSAASSIAGPDRQGKAVALVFSGLTVSLVIGVPLGTWLSQYLGWRPLLGTIGLISLASLIVLFLKVNSNGTSTVLKSNMKTALRERALLAAIAVTVATYSALFLLYTYVASYLEAGPKFSQAQISASLLVFGLAAVLGNSLGGWIRDRIGSIKASWMVIVLLACSMTVLLVCAAQGALVYVGMGMLGASSFGAVAVFQSRIIEIARNISRDLADVASGMNIAGFNLGIVIGSLTGGQILRHWGPLSLVPAALALSLVALLVLWIRPRGRSVANRGQSS